MAHLIWQRRLPWLLLGLTLTLIGGYLLYLQGNHAHGVLAAHGISLAPGACPDLLDCPDHIRRYGTWLGGVWRALVATDEVQPLFVFLSGGAFLIGLFSTAGGFPRARDTLWAAWMLRRRAEEDPWQVRRTKRLRLPKSYGRFWAAKNQIRDMLSSYLPSRATCALLLGRWGKELLALYPGWGKRDELDHTLWVAPTGSGKGMALKTNLLGWTGSVIVNDLKGEYYRDLGGYITETGRRCLVFSTDGCGAKYDPFLEFDEGLGLQAAARLLIKPEQDGSNRIFGDRASNALYAGLLAARRLERPSLPYLAEISAEGMRRYLEALAKLNDPQINRKVNAFLSEPPDETDWSDAKQDRFLQSCWGNFVTKLEPLFSPALLAATDGSDFRAVDLRRRPTQLYLHFPRQTLEATLPLFELVTEALLRGLSTASHPRYRAHPLLWVCDEAHLLTPPGLPQHLNTLREYGVAALVVLQSQAQLSACYGDRGAKAIESACATQVYYRPTDVETPRVISERAGHAPFPQESTSQRQDQMQQNVNVTLTTQPLIRPEAISELADDQIVVFPRGRPPVAAKRLWPTDTGHGRAAFEQQERGGRTLLTPRYPALALQPLKPPVLEPLPKLLPVTAKGDDEEKVSSQALRSLLKAREGE